MSINELKAKYRAISEANRDKRDQIEKQIESTDNHYERLRLISDKISLISLNIAYQDFIHELTEYECTLGAGEDSSVTVP